MRRNFYNKNMNFNSHPLQSFEWAKFREKTGVKVIKGENFYLTIHPLPKTFLNIGYLPKSSMPNSKMLNELIKIGKKERCIFIQLEPNVEKNKKTEKEIKDLEKKFRLKKAAHPLFTKYSFVLDLTQSEEELLKKMHPKTRYNIRLAKKHGVKIVQDNSKEAFKEYLRLSTETTKRQGFYAHTKTYHKILWETLKTEKSKPEKNKLTAIMFLAKYKNKILAAWIIFVFKDTLYYPYGSSSSENREVMASNLIMWEVIKFGKKLGLKKFDMWGSLGPNANVKDSWYGFHKFKQGYGVELIEFVGSYDLITMNKLYKLYIIADKIRWSFLKIKRKFK